MNTQTNWKEIHAGPAENIAFSRFVNMITKSEPNDSQNNLQNEFSYSAVVQHPSRRYPSNVLANSNTLDNSRKIAKTHSPPKQYYKQIHQLSDSSQNNIVISSRMQSKSDVENVTHQRNSSVLSVGDGVIQVSLRHGVRIDITVDNAIRLTSCAGQIVISLSSTGNVSAVKHPNGSVWQIERLVQMAAHNPIDHNDSTRYATMSSDGITFTSSSLDEVFILDSIGTRQINTHITKLTDDMTSNVFFGKSKHGTTSNDEATRLIRKASVKNCLDDEMDVITVNDFRIWQMKDGLVTVARMSSSMKLRASPMNCSFTLTTSHIHCTASSKQSAHLFVRCHDQSMHYDGRNFVVRYNGNSAGFDKNDFLTVY